MAYKTVRVKTRKLTPMQSITRRRKFIAKLQRSKDPRKVEKIAFHNAAIKSLQAKMRLKNQKRK
jgi:hypothetical protein